MKAYYFPICLIKGFEENPQETAQYIQTYCFNQIKDKLLKNGKNKEFAYRVAKGKFDKVELELKNKKIEPCSPITFVSKKYIDELAEGMCIDDLEICTFLYVCAVRSILGKKNNILTNWDLIVGRMGGDRLPIKIPKKANDRNKTLSYLTPMQKKLANRTFVFRKKVLDLCASSYGIGYYTEIGVHGFYVCQNISIVELKREVGEKIKKQKVKSVKDDISKNTRKRYLNDNNVTQILNGFGINAYSTEFVQYVINKSIDITSKQKVVNELQKFEKM